MLETWPTCGNSYQYPASHVDVSVGSILSADGEPIDLPPLSKNVTTSWGEGDYGGALDIGSIAAGFYWLHAIHNPETGSSDILASLSLYSPILPEGFTHRRVVHGFAFDGLSVIPFINEGEWHFYKSRINSVLNVPNNATPILRTLAAPCGAKMQVSAVIEAKAVGGVNAGYVTIRDPDSGTVIPSPITAGWFYQAGVVINTPVSLMTDNLSRVLVGDNNNVDGQLSICVTGWRLDRGVYR